MRKFSFFNVLENKILESIYTLGYLLVPEPRSPNYRLSLNNTWFPLKVAGLAIASLVIIVILIISTIIAILSTPFIFQSKSSQPWEK